MDAASRKRKRRDEEGERRSFKLVEPCAKKMKVGPPPDILCVVCCSESSDPGNKFHIYILDAETEDESENRQDFNFLKKVKDPTFIMREDFPMNGFCTLKSTMYAFEWFPLYDDAHSALYTYSNVTMFSYQVPPNVMDLTNHRLERDILITMPNMKPKNRPILVATPDRRKILAFSSTFATEPFGVVQDEDRANTDFELFTSDGNGGGTWEAFPNFPIGWRESREYPIKIKGYGFIDDDVILIHTNSGFSFTLNTTNFHTPWHLQDEANIIRENCDYFMQVGRLELARDLARDQERDLQFEYSESASCQHLVNRHIVLYEKYDWNCRFCVIKSHVDLEIVFYNLNYNEYREVEPEELHTGDISLCPYFQELKYASLSSTEWPQTTYQYSALQFHTSNTLLRSTHVTLEIDQHTFLFGLE